MRLRRRAPVQPPPIREDEAWRRCHGDRTGDLVRVVSAPRRDRVGRGDLSGEFVRRAFEARLDAREGSRPEAHDPERQTAARAGTIVAAPVRGANDQPT